MEDVKGIIPKPIACPEYRTVYQHQGLLLQNLHCRYLYIVITFLIFLFGHSKSSSSFVLENVLK